MFTKRNILDWLVITVGVAIVSTAVFFFMMPLNITVGSGAALAMVLSNYIPLSVSIITMLINIFLLIIGFLLIGREFGAKTVYCAILMPGILWVYEQLLPNFRSFTNDPLLDVLCSILVVGIGLAILFSRNASSGGLDIVAKLMNKYLRMDLGQAMSISGVLVAATGALCFDMKTVVVSVLGTYFGGLVVDHFIFGMNLKRRVCIISPKLDEITAYVLHELHSGATINEIIGAYDNKPKREIITIVDKQEFKQLMDYVKKTDPKAFITVYSVSEISYQPKK